MHRQPMILMGYFCEFVPTYGPCREKTCLRGFDKASFKPVSSATETSYKIEILPVARLNMVLAKKQVAQWATIAHHGASIMFGDTIIYDAQRQITLNLKQ